MGKVTVVQSLVWKDTRGRTLAQFVATEDAVRISSRAYKEPEELEELADAISGALAMIRERRTAQAASKAAKPERPAS